MIYIFFILLLIGLAGEYLYFTNKVSTIKSQLMRTSSQYTSLRNKYNSTFNNIANIYIKFSSPHIKTAMAKKNAEILLAPIPTSPKIKKLDIMMEVELLDTARIDDTIWFYVSLPIDSSYNCRGWLNSTSLNNLDPNILLRDYQ